MIRSPVQLRRLLVVLVLAVVTAACGNDAGIVDADGSVSQDDGAAPSSVPDTRPGDAANTTTTPGPAPTPAPVPADGAGTTTPPTTQAPVPAPGPVGSYAQLYLSPAASSTTLVEVHSQDGAAPRSGTLDHLRSVLEAVSGKPVAVSTGALGGGAQSWSSDEIRALADANGAGQSRDQSVLKLFYLRGEFEGGDTVVGVAVRSDAVAVFADKVTESAGVLGNRSAVEDAVSLHEVGHILGLVDLVLQTGREDPDHPGHSQNRDSVMYYAVESTLLGTILEGGPPREFDQADLDDLATIRNG